MKNQKENLKGIKKDELKKKLVVLEESIRSIRFKSEGSKSKNVKASASLRKQIARVMTELSNKK